MSYTASASIARIKLKGFVSTSGSLTDAEVLAELNDALRSDVVPFLKSVRDEWFTSGTETVTPDSDGRITMPNSIASTVRLINWVNNGQLVPLPRIEPERLYLYVNNGAGQPAGFMLKGYGLQILPNNVGSISVRLDFMERPAEMVEEQDAGEIASHSGLDLTLASVPLAWQDTAPTTVDLISNESPYSPVAEDVACSLAGSVLTLTGISSSLVEDGFWVSDPGTSPFPNVPIEFHPLLQQYVLCVLGQGFGDKRLTGWQDRLAELEQKLRKLMSPRTQGSARPIVNSSAPGMRSRLGRGF